MSERAKVLIVDDRPENLLALEAILGSLHVDLVRAQSGEEALRVLLRSEVALILLDAQMPGMDGYETAGRIKRRQRTKDVPIIFLTAVDKDPSSSYRGYVAGGADYISKPFDPWILRAKVQVFVSLWEAGRAAASPGVRPDDVPAADVAERVESLAEAVGELAAELGRDGTPPPAALERVQARVDALRALTAAPAQPGTA
jgi:CheY-like chemotaxis protein